MIHIIISVFFFFFFCENDQKMSNGIFQLLTPVCNLPFSLIYIVRKFYRHFLNSPMVGEYKDNYYITILCLIIINNRS